MLKKKSAGKILIGYDLGNLYSQISFCGLEAGEPETVPIVMGTEQYNIPTVLCKRRGANQWFYGKEALKYGEEADGILLERVFELALCGEQVEIDGESFDPVALLSLFVKRSMGILTMEVKTADIEMIMFTSEKLEPRTVEVLGMVAARLQFKPEQVYFQSYRESIFQYVMHQPREIWSQNVLIFEDSGVLKAYLLERNERTKPTVVFVHRQEFPELNRKAKAGKREKAEWDSRFLEIAGEKCSHDPVSAVYLLGEGFLEEDIPETLKFLCRGRRVFRGSNLYSKGACYGALEKHKTTPFCDGLVFLGEDKLKANIGMKVLRKGDESYFAVLDAGSNWYEAKGQYEVILDEGNQLSFVITSLIGGKVTEQGMVLTGLPERPARTTRLQIRMAMIAAGQVRITVTDLGFGELFPADGKTWAEEFAIE